MSVESPTLVVWVVQLDVPGDSLEEAEQAANMYNEFSKKQEEELKSLQKQKIQAFLRELDMLTGKK